MIYIALIVGVLVVIATLYSCIAASTAYDKEMNDREQELFLQKDDK